MNTKKNKNYPLLERPINPKDIPVSIGLMESFRDEMISTMQAGFKAIDARFEGLHSEMRAGFKMVDARIDKLKTEMDAGFKMVDAKLDKFKVEMDTGFTMVDAKIDKLKTNMDTGFSMVDARFTQTDAKIEGLSARLSTMQILTEQQNSNNRAVFEAILNVSQKQDRVEGRIDEQDRLIRTVIKAAQS